MASYGLTVCPILRVAGLLLGCGYSGVYVGLVFSLNTVIVRLQEKSAGPWFRAGWTYAVAYVLASAVALGLLEHAGTVSHAGTQSRAPQILLLASMLLSISQYYGLTWALGTRTGSATSDRSVNALWRIHSLRVLLPAFAMALVLIHFSLTQRALALKSEATLMDMATDGIVLIVFLVLWLCVTYAFHFLSERDFVGTISEQLSSIEAGRFTPTAPSGPWGLWLFLDQRLAQFAQTMRERNFLVKSFSRFVAQDVVQRATRDEIRDVEGESVELSILMLDIRDFTRISGTLASEEIILLLNSYFNMVIEVFVRRGIHIDKFIGDGILAYVDPASGSAVDQNDCALKAIDEILSKLAQLNESLSRENLPAIQIGCGIHRGIVVRGLIGSTRRLEHTIIGDAVNRASRLESLTKEYGARVVVSEAVYEHSSPVIQARLRNLGFARVKGIQQEILVYGY